MREKEARPFKRKDGISGHVVSVEGQERVFVELGKDFSFGRDEGKIWWKRENGFSRGVEARRRITRQL